MRKQILILSILACMVGSVLFTLVSCSDDTTVKLSKSEYDKLMNIPKPEYPKILLKPVIINTTHEINNLQVINIDGCEYIYGNDEVYTGGMILTHKGNCKFCEERRLNEYKLNLR